MLGEERSGLSPVIIRGTAKTRPHRAGDVTTDSEAAFLFVQTHLLNWVIELQFVWQDYYIRQVFIWTVPHLAPVAYRIVPVP